MTHDGAAERSRADEISTDVLVIGAGMAGLAAAAAATGAGASVVLLERAPKPGGSAALSGGYVWTVASLAEMRAENPLGDPEIASLIVDGFDESIDWLASIGVAIGQRSAVSIGRGHQIDVRQYIQRCLELVSSSGFATFDANVRSLRRDANGAVVGALVEQRDGRTRIMAAHTVLATGGFQANARLRGRHIHRNARKILLRSNPFSRGDGMRLGVAAGATTSRFMDGFYGHLMAAPLRRFEEPDFAPLSQYTSHYGVLVNRFGDRFTDESKSDALNAQAVVRQPGARAWLIADEHVRRDLMGKPHMVGQSWIDRFSTAAAAGARYAQAESLVGLADVLRGWGVDPEAFLRTMDRYNAEFHFQDEPPRTKWNEPFREPPFHALEVQPAITFTHGGLRMNTAGRVLGSDGEPIPGLLVAGFDAGGIYHKGYAGGLAVALTTGRTAAKTALGARF